MTFTSKFSLLIALLVGGLAAFLVREVVVSTAGLSRQAGLTTTIVVARKAVPFGMPLTVDNLEEVAWKSTTPLEGSFARVSDLVKDGRRLALLSMQPNEPVLASRITGPNQRATLATQLDEGMRAVTIRVDEVRGVAGFILPGDRVDVISTRGGGGSQETLAYADMLLPNVKVLAVDQLADERQDKPAVARAVTLELTVMQSQKVILAEEIGRLSLVLRQANAVDEEPSRRITIGDLGGDQVAAQDKIADLEKRMADMKAAEEAARTQADRAMAQKMAEIEAHLRAPVPIPAQSIVKVPAVQPKSSSVINVTRNGAKTEAYTVSAER
ncbi:Flp pilus assembly protein CpaB [Lichenifustis flavocetrariae]|uniref:Flp pilus assembly protein CpaB n=1 Tax=Lichenifustis flavocetrariae TaxID=2949735 RepID=A0AA42CLW7_9HYPH|nr:Flp pilus assembly protein CpaB [Lichenifustis flavocetrariae]MCW6511943.1 Flp pilus assembly protein CpaB [Lichenifustis flavocetrariae]